MKDRPILFSAPMVRAILDGRKTQTRRVMKPQPRVVGDMWEWKSGLVWTGESGLYFPVATFESPINHCPYGVPGDRLRVRETWRPFYECDTGAMGIQYKGGHYEEFPPQQMEKIPWRGDGDAWRPSIHMFRWSSRITLEITDVRVQRVQEISGADAMAEGRSLMLDSPAEYFPDTWDSINGKKHPWAANPWVWALTFKRI